MVLGAIFVGMASIGWGCLGGYLVDLVGLDFPWIATIGVVSGVLGIFPTMKLITWLSALIRREPRKSDEEVAEIFS